MIDFNNVKHMKRYQFDSPQLCQIGSGWNINEEIVYILDDIITLTGWKAIPHWSIFGGVVIDDAVYDFRFCKSKWHLLKYGCKAIDFHFETEATPKEQFKVLYESNVQGIGIFTNLALATREENKADLLTVAFHIDIGERKEREIWVYPENKNINIKEWIL